jgi:plasmid replication initiation protein
MVTAKKSMHRRSRKVVTDKGLEQFLPTSVQKSYFMLSDAERAILDTALEKYLPGQFEPILVGDKKVLKPALRLMARYRLKIEEVFNGRAVTSYTRWVDAVQVRGAENEQVCVTFGPRFEHIWLESRKLLLDYLAQKPAVIGLRSKYAIRLYTWAKNHGSTGRKRLTFNELRAVLGLDSVRDADGSIIREAPLAAWANFRNRALYTAIKEINKKTDLNIVLESLEQAEHGRVAALILAIKPRTVSKRKNYRGPARF